jgi:hypothetical protein
MSNIGREFDPVTWDVVMRDHGRCVYCGADMTTDMRLLRNVFIDHVRPKKCRLTWEEQESRSNKAVSCRFCNNRKGGWDPAEKNDSALGLEPEQYRLELIRRSKEHIEAKPPCKVPALPAVFFDALYDCLNIDMTRTIPPQVLYEATVAHEQSQATIQSAIPDTLYTVSAIGPTSDGKEAIHLTPNDPATTTSHRTIWPMTPPHGISVGDEMTIGTRYPTPEMLASN